MFRKILKNFVAIKSIPPNRQAGQRQPFNSAGSQLSQQPFLAVRAMSAQTGTDLVVHHDPGSRKFFIQLGDAEAKLEYVTEDYVLDLWHTEVPPQLQGKGIAKILAKEAFDYVVQNNLKMRLSCTYLQKYFNDNPLPKYKDAVV